MAVLTEGMHAGEFIVSEANGNRSREQGRLATGDLDAGTVLGQVTTAGTATADGGNTGNGTAGSVTLGSEAINGTYTLTCTAEATDAGTFSVVTPLGEALDDLTVAVAYTSAHVNLTIADGAEDFDIGDIFTIDVIIGEYAIHNPAESDGTETAKAILWDNVDASSAEQDCTVVARDCEVNEAELTFKSGMTEVQKATALTALKSVGIITR